MNRSIGLPLTLIALCACAAGPAWGQTSAEKMGQNAADMKFSTFPALPGCAVGSVVNGDPDKGPSIIYAKTATGCVIPWHWHTPSEHLMIVKGVARLEMQGGAAPLTLRAGGYAMTPAKHVHRLRCKSSCEFYVYSDGAFDIHYVDAQGKELTPDEALKRSGQPKKD